MKIQAKILALASIAISTVAMGDEVTDEIQAALKAYEAGEYSAASTALQQAVNLVNEKKSGNIGKALPDTIGQWTGGEIENQGGGLAMLGGGSMIRRTYTQGDKSISVQITADSPMLAQFIGVLNNPAMAGAMGMKTKRLGDQVALYNSQDNSLVMIVQNRFMVQIEASENAEAEVLEIAGGIDRSVLTGLK